LRALSVVLFLAGASPALAIPGREEIEITDGLDRVDLLLSFGLEAEAERTLRSALVHSGDWARAPLVQLLVRQARYAEAGTLVEEWGGPGGLGTATPFFLAGRVREGEQKWTEAALAYTASATREPLLADHASYRAGSAYEELGNQTEALAYYESAGESARHRGLSAMAHWKAADLATQTGDPERALDNLEKIPARSIIPRKDLLTLEATIHRVRGDEVREALALRELLERAPSSDVAVDAIARLTKLEKPSAADRVAFAEAALEIKHASLAAEQARAALKLLRTDADPRLEGKARLIYGKSLLARRRLTAARRELDRLPDDAAPEDRAEALLDRARCLWRLGQIDACLAEYDVVINGPYPDEEREAGAWEAGREAKDNQRWREAAIRLQEFQRTFPESDYADDALWHGGRALVELGETQEAVLVFRRLANRYPESHFLQESIYWTATLFREEGDEEAACAELTRLLRDHPDSYWTGRVRESEAAASCPTDSALGAVVELDPFVWLAEIFPDVEDAEEARRACDRLLEAEPLRRASALAAMGLATEADTELASLRRTLARDPVALVGLADAAWRIGTTRVAMRAISTLKEQTGKQILSGETPPRVARLLYPVEHLDSVLRWSAAYDVDPLFVYAVMREESWFDPQAISWAGAHGLLQIMPSTGRDLARRIGLARFERSDLFKPDVNIRLGSYYLSALLDELDREPTIALSAYNAGKHNALRWKKGIDGEFDVDRYVVGITYRETYHYVQRVTRSWAIYRHLYGDLVPRLQEIGNGDHSSR
jgi:soluble lytic murein transglycosylase